ncbi:MAG: glycosyltransferase family 39 protein [Patescibacteria group bacterium]|nr:glycosyltransferase family 39 protein [Patescibacteria group bacterium]
MPRRNVFWLLSLVLIIAAFLRFYHFTLLPPGLYPDEAMDGNNAVEALHTGDLKVYYPENNGREGLFMNMQALLMRATGVMNEPWILRLPSAIFGLLTVLGIYFLAAELFSPAVGLFSSFLVATSFWHIMFSRIGFRAILAPFFLTWALYLFLSSLKHAVENEEGSHKKSGVLNSKSETISKSQSVNPKRVSCLEFRASCLAALGGLLYGLGFYTYISYRVSPLLFLLFIPFLWRDKKFWRTAAIFVGAAFLVALPIGLYYLHHPADFFGRTSEISVFASPTPLKDLAGNILKTALMFNWRGDENWRQNYAGAPELFWPVGILFLIGLALAIKNLFSKTGRQAPDSERNPSRGLRVLSENQKLEIGILLLWLLLAALPVVISDEGIPHALRAILMIPPVFILAALGGAWLYAFLARFCTPLILKSALAAFVLMLAAQAYYAYFDAWGGNPNVQGAFAADYAEIGRTINDLPPAMPKYVVVDAGGVLVRGIPMPAETVMFITGTYLPEGQRAKNVHYVLPQNAGQIPAGAAAFHIQ